MILRVEHFRKEEFACPCCGEARVSEGLVLMLEMIRRAVGVPLVLSSGFRCKKHNGEVGGASMSRHLIGCAADILLPKNQTYEGFISLLHRFAGEGYEVVKYPSRTYAHYAIPRASLGRIWSGKGIVF